MKKGLKILMAMATVLIAVNASAQIGVKVGYLSSTEKYKQNGVKGKTKAIGGFKAGVDYDVDFGMTGLSVRPGLMYSYLGSSQKSGGDTYQVRYHFLSVPVDLKYQYDFANGFGLYAFAGPRFVMGLSGKVIQKGSGYKRSFNLYSGKWKETDGTVEEIGTDPAQRRRFDIELGTGVGVAYKGISLEFGYDWGLLKQLKSPPAGYTLKRNQLGITLGYAF